MTASVVRADSPERTPSNWVAPVFMVSELAPPVIASPKRTFSLEVELVIVVLPASVTGLVKVMESELKLPFRLAAPFVTVRSAVEKLPSILTVPLVLISVSVLKFAPAEKERFPAPETSDQFVISGVPVKLVEPPFVIVRLVNTGESEKAVALPFVIVKESIVQLPLTERLPPFLFSSMFV